MRRFVLALRHTLRRVYCLLSTLVLHRRRVHHQGRTRATVLVILGGSRFREIECAKLGRSFSSVADRPAVIVLSSGASIAQELADSAGVPLDRVCLDCRAVDTVTNFTMLVHDLAGMGCQEVAIATSKSHMRRASAVATIVLGSYGMQIQQWACSDAAGEKIVHFSRALIVFSLTLNIAYISVIILLPTLILLPQ